MSATVRRAGRVGDQAYAPRDAHSCSLCSHAVFGPAAEGSPNVLINGRRALRIGDLGKHSTCCGPNRWRASKGASHVKINDRLAHRQHDATHHCGGMGELVHGSADVLIGDHTGAPSRPHWIRFRVTDFEGEPIRSARINARIEGADRTLQTDQEGYAEIKGIDPTNVPFDMGGLTFYVKG
jgi:uncharacterized Zn-binding protein involved in type VI secretion